jgi:hypothetical protein
MTLCRAISLAALPLSFLLAFQTNEAFAHGTAKEYTEKYWSWCGWYPCRKTRTVTKWEYSNLYVKITKWGFYCTYDACQQASGGNVQHEWSGGCLGLGTRTCYWSGTRDNKLADRGSCTYQNNPSIERC